MDFTYESQGTNTYLVYEIKEGEQIDSTSLGMLTNNRIAGFVPTFFTQENERKFIKYNVSSKVSVKQFFSGAVNKKRLIGVFGGIVEGLLSAEEYMIDPETIVLDLDYIFADVSTCETSVVCLPLAGSGKGPVDLNGFFKNVIFGTQFDQTENCDHVAKIISFLNSSPVVSLDDFKKLIESVKNGARPAVQPSQGAAQSSPRPAVKAQPEVRPEERASAGRELHPEARPEAQPRQAYAGRHVPLTEMPVKPANQGGGPDKAHDGEPDKKMSLFTLLTHYSKDNAKIYKAQKEAREAKEPKEAKKGKARPAAPKNAQPAARVGVQPKFAIPGQSAPAPEQSRPVRQNEQPSQRMAGNTRPGYGAAPERPAVRSVAPPLRQMRENFGETTVLGGGMMGETTVLGEEGAAVKKIEPYLLRAKNNEKIPLNKPVFRIGKERSYVDYFVADNTAVSRSHANIISREGRYFIVDTNSTNHTYVEGQMIQSNAEVEIGHGARIRLANEEFEFRLY